MTPIGLEWHEAVGGAAAEVRRGVGTIIGRICAVTRAVGGTEGSNPVPPAAILQTFGPSRDERLHPFTRAAVLPTGGATPKSRQRKFSPRSRSRRGSLASSATRSPGSPRRLAAHFPAERL